MNNRSLKICCSCEKELDISNFSISKKRKDGLQSQCINCQKTYRRNHYLKNKEKYKEKSKKWKKAFHTWFQKFKTTLVCQKCDENHPACLEFHHKDPNEKESSVSQLVQYGNKKKLLEEIKKCDVLCANCHRKHHAKNKSVCSSVWSEHLVSTQEANS